MIRGVIFDLDGLLVDSETVQYRCNATLLAEYGVEYSDELHPLILGRSLRDGLSIFKKKLGIQADLEEMIRQRDNILRGSVGEIKLMLGAKKLLSKLKRAGLKSAVATSGPRWYLDALRKTLQLDKYFEAFVSVDEVKNPKPHPETFLRAARQLALMPSECVVLEDAPVGIEAALSAGMKAVAVLHRFTQPENFPEADLVVANLSEITIGLIRSLAECDIFPAVNGRASLPRPSRRERAEAGGKAGVQSQKHPSGAGLPPQQL